MLLLTSTAYAVDSWRYAVTVLRVVDGDTIEASIEMGLGMTRKAKIRLLGYNAPELRQPGGLEAKQYLDTMLSSTLCTDLDAVTTRGKEFDSFGRVLASLHCPGTEIADDMIRAGHGVKYP